MSHSRTNYLIQLFLNYDIHSMTQTSYIMAISFSSEVQKNEVVNILFSVKENKNTIVESNSKNYTH